MLNSTNKKIYSKKRNDDKDRKVLYKLMNNALYGKTMEKLRNRIAVKFYKTIWSVNRI